MGIKVTLCKLTVEDVETEIADVCPGCGQDLTVDGAKCIEERMMAIEQKCERLGDEFDEYGSTTDFFDHDYITGYKCECGQQLVSQEVVPANEERECRACAGLSNGGHDPETCHRELPCGHMGPAVDGECDLCAAAHRPEVVDNHCDECGEFTSECTCDDDVIDLDNGRPDLADGVHEFVAITEASGPVKNAALDALQANVDAVAVEIKGGKVVALVGPNGTRGAA